MVDFISEPYVEIEYGKQTKQQVLKRFTRTARNIIANPYTDRITFDISEDTEYGKSS
jgi:hypothetical protein